MESEFSESSLSDKPVPKRDDKIMTKGPGELWPSLMACHSLISGEIRLRLRRRFSVTLPRYELMAQLSNKEGGLSMGELSRRLRVSNGNITGITDRLVSEDLVVRYSLPNDRRTYYVKLTPRGQDTFDEISESYHEWLEELLEGISPEQTAELDRLLHVLRHSVSARINAMP